MYDRTSPAGDQGLLAHLLSGFAPPILESACKAAKTCYGAKIDATPTLTSGLIPWRMRDLIHVNDPPANGSGAGFVQLARQRDGHSTKSQESKALPSQTSCCAGLKSQGTRMPGSAVR